MTDYFLSSGALRMKMNLVLSSVCLVMIALVPAALVAAGAGVGMVHPYGAAWQNGAAIEQSSTIFPGDLLQTSPNSAMKISASGSSVTVLSDSLVKFEGSSVAVEHGGVKLLTSKSMIARTGNVTATPASSGPTEFELTEVNGRVQIVALKGDLQISNGSETTILPQGQQATQNVRAKQEGAIAIASDSTATRSGFLFGAAGSGDSGARNLEVATNQTLGHSNPDAVKALPISPKKP